MQCTKQINVCVCTNEWMSVCTDSSSSRQLHWFWNELEMVKQHSLQILPKNKRSFSLLNPSLFPSGNWNIFLELRGLRPKGRLTVTLQVSQLILLPNKSALYILIYERNPHVKKRRLEVNLCFNNKNKKLLLKPFQSHGLNGTSCTCGHHANKILSLRSNFFVGQKSG